MGAAALPASDRVILLSACRQITALEAEIDGLEGEIARGVADVPAVQVLLTITGMGLIGAAATWAILAESLAPIHEPSTLALLAAGIVGLVPMLQSLRQVKDRS